MNANRNRISVAAALLLGVAAATFAAGSSELSLSMKPGRAWSSVKWFGIFPVRLSPQLAAWIETAEGRYVATIAVTEKAARKSWTAAPAGGRPESLPIWYHAAGGPVSDGFAAVDAASSATPKGPVDLGLAAGALEPGATYVVKLEVNKSFDYNEAWPKGAKVGQAGFSGVNGQPSVLYEARFVAGSAGSVGLEPVGRGAVDGSSGEIAPGLEGLSTALEILDSATLTVR
jgi:hypothetical protein